MQFSWIEDTQPSVDLGYACNDAEGGFVTVKPLSILKKLPIRTSRSPVPGSLQDEYDLGGYAGI
jgi:hypothetical protein